MIDLTLQKYFYTQLNTYLSVPVFDHVPENYADYPYVVIGSDTTSEWGDELSTEAVDATLVVNIWSQYLGKKEVKTLMSQIINLLDIHDITYEGYNIVIIENIFSDTLVEKDGITRKGVLRFRALAEKI